MTKYTEPEFVLKVETINRAANINGVILQAYVRKEAIKQLKLYLEQTFKYARFYISVDISAILMEIGTQYKINVESAIQDLKNCIEEFYQNQKEIEAKLENFVFSPWVQYVGPQSDSYKFFVAAKKDDHLDMATKLFTWEEVCRCYGGSPGIEIYVSLAYQIDPDLFIRKLQNFIDEYYEVLPEVPDEIGQFINSIDSIK